MTQRQGLVALEQEPFIEVKTDAGRLKRNTSLFVTQWQTLSPLIKLLFHLAIISVYTLTAILWVRFNSYSQQLPAILNDIALEYKSTRFKPFFDSPYGGVPSFEVDQAWHNLMDDVGIRVSKEELDRNGNHHKSIALPDGGYLAWLEVYHNLHCVKMLRQWVYRDHYHGNMTVEEEALMASHINHCLELLRQAVSCNPDTSLTTFEWYPDKPKPVLDIRRFEHTCVDWEAMTASVEYRLVSKQEVEALVNPRILDPKA